MGAGAPLVGRPLVGRKPVGDEEVFPLSEGVLILAVDGAVILRVEDSLKEKQKTIQQYDEF